MTIAYSILPMTTVIQLDCSIQFTGSQQKKVFAVIMHIIHVHMYEVPYA